VGALHRDPFYVGMSRDRVDEPEKGGIAGAGRLWDSQKTRVTWMTDS
jgi:hypothetical protein